jgi:hypothetical protein
MPTDSDERMAKLKAAINRCRHGDLSALLGIEMGIADLITIGALAKATGDIFTHSLTQRLLATRSKAKD